VLYYITTCTRTRRWLVSRRLRDLSLYDPASTLDLDSLAYTMYLHESQVSRCWPV
jgi:hypothetical protein